MGGNTSVPPHAGPSSVGREGRRRVGGKYVSHTLGEVAVVLEEEGQ